MPFSQSIHEENVVHINNEGLLCSKNNNKLKNAGKG